MTTFASYILIAFSLLYAFAYPFWTEVSLKMEEKTKYQKIIEDVNMLNQRKDQILSQMDSISPENQNRINSFMPSALDFVKLTSDINAVGSKYGISVDRVNSTKRDRSVGNSIEEAQPAKVYDTASINFGFSSSYQNFIKFVNDLESSLRILDINTVSINPKEGGVYDFTMEMDTYWAE